MTKFEHRHLTTARGRLTRVQGKRAANWNLSNQMGLTIAALASVLVAMRLLAIADLNPVSAIAILQNVGFANVLIGTLVPAVPILSLTAFFVVVLAHQSGARSLGDYFPWIALTLLAVSILIANSNLLATVLILLGLDKLARSSLRRWSPSLGTRTGGEVGHALRLAALGGRAVITLFVVVALFSIQPWLAREEIRTANGARYSGYVLSQDSDKFVLLGARDRRVLYVDEAIAERAICQSVVGVAEGRSLVSLALGQNQYPSCPDE